MIPETRVSKVRRNFLNWFLVLGACVGVQAQLIVDRQVTIQPIQVLDDSGNNPANPGLVLNEAAADKIWLQAEIEITFLPWSYWNSTLYQNIGGSGQPTITDLRNNGEGGSSVATVINMWFVKNIAGSTVGLTIQGSKTIAIDDGMKFDTIAHEIGHALGLDHTTFGNSAQPSYNLMSDGAFRTSPTSVANIYPDGSDLDRLSSLQVLGARASSFATPYTPVPEPGQFGLAVGSLLVTFGILRLHVRQADV